MAYDINLALERLEKNLQDINSAKEQIEDTINASSQLQNVVNGYVASVNAVLQETILLKEEIAKMRVQKVTEIKEAVTSIEASCNTIIAEFKKNSSSILTDFVSQNDRLAKSNEELSAFQTKLEQSIEITSGLKTRQDEISADVHSIHNKLQESTENISKQYGQLSQKVDADMTMLTNSMSKEFSRLSERTEELNRAITKNQRDIEELCKQISDQHADNLKNININRWMLIAGILILAALQFIIK
ncbi:MULTISPECIES: hypothetical protein [Prevotella]|jgi:hypothetical protein|uniref:hypothetical protein n=1 Tax=Prevotella TaxID=838 RepID=UPI0001C403EB|nr:MULTISPECIES: hypothetical protein [Prevotella]EFC68514.1 hypothetical protein HMPREF0670_01685 [Prevotella sp. oral taxon 317 str. F0108]